MLSSSKLDKLCQPLAGLMLLCAASGCHAEAIQTLCSVSHLQGHSHMSLMQAATS